MPSLDLNNTFGALLLGTIISSMLFGAMCLQSYHYFTNYSDGALTKYAVAALVILESLHSAFSIHAIYYYLVLNYANPVALLTAVWTATGVIAVTCFIQCIVHLFYIRRVYIVSQKNRPLTICLALLELVSVGTGLSTPILALQISFLSEFGTLPKLLVPAAASLASSAAVDILVAGSLTMYLRSSKTGIRNTDKLIDRLVVHAVNNGIITSIASVLCLVFDAADRTTLLYFMVYECSGHLYANTMLSTLNTRASTSRRVLPTSVELSGIHTSGFKAIMPSSAPSNDTTSKTTQGNDIEINVHTFVN